MTNTLNSHFCFTQMKLMTQDVVKKCSVDRSNSQIVANIFEDNWLSWYPTPRCHIYDDSSEFLGPEFSHTVFKINVMPVLTPVKNSQSNALKDRLHQTCNTTIAISLQENSPQSFEEVSSLIMEICCCSVCYSDG